MAAPDDELKGQAEQAVTITRRRSRVQKGEGLWLMSFSDMSLILMSFFVLQLSYSTPDKHKYDNLNSAIQEQRAPPAKSLAAGKGVDNLRTLSNKLQVLIKEKRLSEVAEVSRDMNGLAIEFKDRLLFEPGSAELSAGAKAQVGAVLATIAAAPGDYQLVFEGHTDDVPMNGGRFPSNWELSSARGIALVNGFRARGVSESRMGVRAFAHTRPKVPVAGLSGEALRKARAANRRVVIRLE